jgi:CubicO group peptidase (beta-lactamase class C family)
MFVGIQMSISRRPAVLSTVLWVCGSLLAAQTAPTAAASPSDAQAHIEKVKACLPEPIAIKNDPHACRTLAEQMAELHVPGVSIAVVHNGVIEWAPGFGVQQVSGRPVTADTLFQAGSISKPLAAMAALHLVQQGKLSLDSDVNAKLTTWKIPASSAAPGAVVTCGSC